ncbi:MAG: 4-alpha-glucanotransferase [Fusobacteriaceae bacterium]
MFKRSSGILMHITSLPSEYGIGDFGKSAYEFVDFLHSAEQKLWQILPMGATGYGDSPYQSFSAFAGNPYFIDLEALLEDELLINEELNLLKEHNKENGIDYGFIYTHKLPLLKKAYKRFLEADRKKELKEFKVKHKYWIEDYCLFMSLKEKFNHGNWNSWPEEYKNREKDALKKVKEELKNKMDYYLFVQYIFFMQWEKLKVYANSKSVKIIGDIPIFVAPDSSDAWSKSEMFLFDKNKNPKKVAGCPPDAFSEDGQLWGNPLYDWKVIEKDGFSWWIERIKACFEIHDIVRIDHFRGFESYWAIPAGSPTAVNGKWEKGPGMKLFHAIKEAVGDMPIIAEDLGFLTPAVEKLLKDSEYPGMKILLFAFDSKEENDYLPNKYPKNSVAYTGTHDNRTVLGWYQNCDPEDKESCEKYLEKMPEVKSWEINWKFIEAVWSTKSQLALAQMQDILGLGDEARMNTPSTSENNWQWRLKSSQLTEDLAQRLKKVTKEFRR